MHRFLNFLIHIKIFQQHVIILNNLLSLYDKFVQFYLEHSLSIGEEVISNMVESQITCFILVKL